MYMYDYSFSFQHCIHVAVFMSCVEECISERECRKFEEGLNNKVKLAVYKTFGKNVEFKME